jgi:Domain of unknown function (DUF4082)
MNRKSICLLGLLVALVLVLPTDIKAQTFGVDFSNTTGALTLGNPPFTLGWSFTLAAPVQVGDLAFYNDGTEVGLTDSHQIGIWDSTGTLLVSGTVLAGTASPLVDQWREVAITPTTLGPGTYDIGALFLDGSDPVWFPGQSLTGFVTAPGLTYNGATYVSGSTLSDPTNSDSTPGFFGANFVETVATPEPSITLLLGISTGLLGLFRMVSLRKAA